MYTKTQTTHSQENGSVLLITLVLMVGFSALVTGSLSVMVSEHAKTTKRHYAKQVTYTAEGQLELARNIVNASRYDVNLNNLVLLNALDAPNQVIPGTGVRVERIGATEYYTLRTQATAHGITKAAEAVGMGQRHVPNAQRVEHPQRPQ